MYEMEENSSVECVTEFKIAYGKTIDNVRNEEGNEKYEYFFPMDDNETVMLIDKWESQEALDLHHKSEMMIEIANLRNKHELKMRVERFTEFEEK